VRTHGVPNFPDPNSSGEFDKTTLHQLAVSNSHYQTATSECGYLLPNGGRGPTQAQLEQQRLDMEEFARCMRSHGVPNWPGPTLDPDGHLVFDSQSIPRSAQITSKISECVHVFPTAMGIPPGA
jgi:hypothetical protein